MIKLNHLVSKTRQFKLKICLLGNLESHKDEFQESVSSRTLSEENKQYIGVNISRIDFQGSHELYLWNVDCSREFAPLRLSFYRGSEAMIVLIPEQRVEQILQYWEEIRSQLPVITVVFCIILDHYSREEMSKLLEEDPSIQSFTQSKSVKIHERAPMEKIFNQVYSQFLLKIDKKRFDDAIFINFLERESLFNDNTGKEDGSTAYHEPSYHGTGRPRRNNVEALKSLLSNMELRNVYLSDDWVKIPHEKYGTFSIFLRNGAVYLTPLICHKCKHRSNCNRHQDEPFYVCIEAETNGWSNRNDLEAQELSVLSKILALATNCPLPESIITQCEKINSCPLDA